MPGINFDLIFKTLILGGNEIVLKVDMELIRLKVKDNEKKIFKYFPNLLGFFSHFSEKVLIEISSNPGSFFSRSKIGFYMGFLNIARP